MSRAYSTALVSKELTEGASPNRNWWLSTYDRWRGARRRGMRLPSPPPPLLSPFFLLLLLFLFGRRLPLPSWQRCCPSAASALTEEAHEALLPHMRVKDVRSPGPGMGVTWKRPHWRLARRYATSGRLPPQQHAPQELVRRERLCARQKEFPPPPPVACDRHKLAPPPQQQVQGAPLALRPPGERWGTEERRDI